MGVCGIAHALRERGYRTSQTGGGITLAGSTLPVMAEDRGRKKARMVNAMDKSIFTCGLVLTAATLFTLGCNRGADVPQTYSVQGTVIYQGRVVEGAQVSFVAMSAGEDQRGASGTTDAEGLYTLRTYVGGRQSADGALPGEYSVGILALDSANLGRGKPSTSTRPKNLLPDRYADPKSSGLSATVLEEQGQQFDFNLSE